MTGVVEGGWEFVIAAYLLTAAVLGAYAASVFVRLAAERNRAAGEAHREGEP